MIKVPDKFKILYTTKKPIILITGGRGGAKSFNASLFVKRLIYEKGHVVLYSRYTMTSAEKSVIPEFTEKIKLEGDAQYFQITQREITNTISDSKIIFDGIKTSSGDQTAKLKGIQGLTTFIVDEGEEWQSEKEFDDIRLSIRTVGIQNRIIIIMNPSSVNHFVFKKFIEPSYKEDVIDGVPVQISTMPNVEHIHSTYFDNLQHLSKEFLSEINEIKVSNLIKYKHVVIGRWNDYSDENALFAWYKITDMFTNFIQHPANVKKYISCDAARYGRDFCVIMVWKGWEVIHISIISKSDIHDIIKEIEYLRLKFQIQKSNTIVDADGIGADAVKMGAYRGFHGGKRPEKVGKILENYKNFKTQCAYYLAENIVNAGLIKINVVSQAVKVDGHFESVIKIGTKLYKIAELISNDFRAVRYANTDSEGKKTINSKEEQKDILGRSPDFFDCINMRVAFEFIREPAFLKI